MLLTMEEIWKPVVGWEKLYEVSSLGRVRSFDRTTINKAGHAQRFKGRTLRAAADKDSYDRVVLCVGKKRVNRIVHRLMAEAFIPNPNHLPEVNHIDENKRNNILSNLEWCTDKYNVNHGTALQRRAASQRNHPNESKPVRQYTKAGKFIAEYPSIKEASRQTGIKKDSISRSCRGLLKYNHKFYWKFKV